MALDVKIVGGTLLLDGESVRAGLGIKDGRIAVIAAEPYLPNATLTIDATGRHVLPGAIDAHLHTRDPGRPELEDFGTATQSAAVGGVTTIIDMPGTDVPMLRDVAALENKVRVVTPRAHVDFALRGAVLVDNLDEIGALAEAGVVAYKVLMGKSTYTPIVPDGVLIEAFRRVAATGRLMGVHAENNFLIDHLTEQLQREGRMDALAHFDSRPGYVEAEAAQRAILYARVAGARLHVHHIGAAEVAAQIRAAKAAGQDVTGETCPHYLILSTEDYERLGMVAKVNPSIKTPADRDALRLALADGTIDTLASDHAPHSEEEKLRPTVWEALAGFPGVETLVPLMLNEVSEGRLSIARFVDATAVRPARIYGLHPAKGALALGSDADVMIADLDRRWTIEDRLLHSRTRVSPFDGRAVRGRVEMTLVRGMVVARDGETVGTAIGRWVRA